MKTFKTYSNIGLRFAILSVLGMALMVVAKPQSAMAIPTCLQGCLVSLQVCILTVMVLGPVLRRAVTSLPFVMLTAVEILSSEAALEGPALNIGP